MKPHCNYCGKTIFDDNYFYCHRCGDNYCPICHWQIGGCSCTDRMNNLEAEEKKMASLKDEALAFKPSTSKNIADLEVVSVELDLKKEEKTNNKGESFSYMYIEKDGEKYRVPTTVLKNLKSIMQKVPNLTHFSVSKEGTGMETRYMVIPRTDMQ